MIKIFMTVRNRLAITKKAIEALKKHSTIPHQIYVYDNNSTYLVDKHFEYFMALYKKNIISQITFTTDASTFNAFSKATTCNMFGLQHEIDPKKDKYFFLLFIDNDIIVTPGWDKPVKTAWDYINRKGLKNVKVVGQLPGGIKGRKDKYEITPEINGFVGILGGSGLWTVRPNFFRDVGFLDLNKLVGQAKKHDQLYWQLMSQATHNNPYIMGLNQKLGIHCGGRAGSVCNQLTKHRNDNKKYEFIKFEEAERRIDSMDFDSFYKSILDDQALLRDW
jgi:hypothetical protein